MRIITFGAKYNDSPKCDEYVDVRCYIKRNPYHRKELRYLSGQDPKVVETMNRWAEVQDLIQLIIDMYEPIKDNPNFVLGICCTGGRHRSVYVAECVASKLGVEVTHRDIHRRKSVQ